MGTGLERDRLGSRVPELPQLLLPGLCWFHGLAGGALVFLMSDPKIAVGDCDRNEKGRGAGEQTDRKREACRPPERKLTSGSSGVSQPPPELLPDLCHPGFGPASLCSPGCGHPTWRVGIPAVGEKRLGGLLASWPRKNPRLSE